MKVNTLSAVIVALQIGKVALEFCRCKRGLAHSEAEFDQIFSYPFIVRPKRADLFVDADRPASNPISACQYLPCAGGYGQFQLRSALACWMKRNAVV
jgi:hypothetical protein